VTTASISPAAATAATTVATLRHFVTQLVTRVALPSAWSIEHATREIARSIELPDADAEARQTYELFRRRDGRTERLNPSSRVGEVIEPGDEVEAMPEVIPGGRR
jgi:hypothetical protein